MSFQKILSIAIPTWNRSVLVNELLEDLIKQILEYNLSEFVEIVVSNNGSEDNTHEVVEKFRNKHSFITYNRNSSNIGGQPNVHKAFQLASGDFLIYLGDDDRICEDGLFKIVEFLKANKDIGIVIDISGFKKSTDFNEGLIELSDLLKSLYWFVGNAGFFIMRSDFAKESMNKYGPDFFNECWSQTQFMILGLNEHKNLKAYIKKLKIISHTVHEEVMIYSSFYIWRTCYYDLSLSINDLKDKIPAEVYDSAKLYLKKSLPQQLFNILQCGIFIDEQEIKRKTRSHIFKHLNLFSFYERLVLWIIIIALLLPVWISKPLSDIFIFSLKGKQGIKTKNDFVLKELSKKMKLQTNKTSIRTMEFEK